ncbi:hypothetical protein GWG67_12780 [Bradyrhizobium sp. CSS354]|nr:hypothetical protein [Bradyrhizobium sp. CSS354]
MKDDGRGRQRKKIRPGNDKVKWERSPNRVARHGKLPPQRHEELPPPRIAEERVNEAGTNH